MFGPFIELVADAIDLSATILVLLALWEGRSAPGRTAVLRWLGVKARPESVLAVDDFLRQAQRSRSAPAGPLSATPVLVRPVSADPVAQGPGPR